MFSRAVLATVIGLAAMGLSGCARDLVLAEGGKSDYQIVVPDTLPNAAITRQINQAGSIVQNAFKAAGCEMPVVAEKDIDPGKPGIYLSNTEFLRASGVDLAKLEGWGYVHKVVGRNVIVAGRDEPPPATQGMSNRVGTEKAVADFLRVYAGTRFLYPVRVADDENSIEYASTQRIAIPADLDIVKDLVLQVNYTYRQEGSFYHIANNVLPCVDLLGSAHSYGEAIPIEKYRETNPEYFALLNTKDGPQRACNVKNWYGAWTQHYCVSNPDVGKLLYEFLLGKFDKGYNMVVLGPMDGFQKCQCENCKNLYDTGDDWGEKLWLFHRDICLKLLEARPDKKVLALAYTVTERPPKSFTRFPENMMVQICGTNERDWEAWKDIEVPAGYVAYLYNWGVYHQGGGYTPKRTAKHVERQAKRLAEHNVVGIYKDGYGELFGLEGPVYYTFGRMYDDPMNLTSEMLMDEFCTGAFGAVAAPALRFFNRLYKGIEFYSDEIGIRCLRWNEFTRDSFELIRKLYTPELMEALERDLSEAEKAADSDRVRHRLRLVRWEFNYLNSLAKVVNLYYEHKAKPDDKVLLAKLLDAIDARNAEIEVICDKKKRAELDKDGGWGANLFPPPGHSFPHLKMTSDRYRSKFGKTAVNWDTDAMREQSGIPKPVVKPGGGVDPIEDFENRN